MEGRRRGSARRSGSTCPRIPRVAVCGRGQPAFLGRHARMHEARVAGQEALGLQMLVAPEHRLPQLNTVRVPEGVDEAAVRAHMLARWDLEIGAGLGPLKGQVWRIGLMGASATPWHVRLCLTALADALAAQGEQEDLAVALAAAVAHLG